MRERVLSFVVAPAGESRSGRAYRDKCRSRWCALALATSFVLVLSACDAKPQDHGQNAAPVTVSVVTITPKRVPLSTDMPGRTTAFRVAEVRPQVSGIILKRMFPEGSDVKAGQQLYQIDPALYQATLESARADLEKAQANLRSIAAKAARYAELVKVNAVGRQDYDDAVANLDQAKAQISLCKAAVDTARINLDYTKVYAPITGRINKSSVTEGALVTANQATALATITQLDPIYVDVSQSSEELFRLREAVSAGVVQASDSTKAPVTLKLDGRTAPYAETGRLEFSDVTVDQSTGTVHVRAIFPNARHELYPGLFVRARVETGSREDAILVPQPSLVRNPDGSTVVWVVGEDGKASPRPVEVAQSVGDQWLLNSGIGAGDRVIVEGLQKVQPGATVRIADDTKTAPSSGKL